jgi:hypothetical protein
LQRAEGPPERLDTGGIAIDQVSKYSTLGVVYQEDGSWQAHAQKLAKMQQPMGTEATAVMQQSADKGQTFQTFIYSAVMYGAEVWTRRRRSKTRCQRS